MPMDAIKSSDAVDLAAVLHFGDQNIDEIRVQAVENENSIQVSYLEHRIENVNRCIN